MPGEAAPQDAALFIVVIMILLKLAACIFHFYYPYLFLPGSTKRETTRLYAEYSGNWLV